MSETLERLPHKAVAPQPAPSGVIQPGERMPFLHGVAANGQFYAPDSQAGRPAILIVGYRVAAQTMRPLAVAFARAAVAFAERGADVVIAASEDVVRALATQMPRGAPVRLVDAGSRPGSLSLVRRGEIAVLVIDRAQRLVARYDAGADADPVAACINCIDALPAEAPTDCCLPAPVLMLPRLLPSTLCRTLIDQFERDAEAEKPLFCHRIDHHKKRRREILLAADDPLQPVLTDLLLSRCQADIARAFQCRIAHVGPLTIARYDAAEGWFRRHRDNTGANMAHREFAISVNLNAEDYTGGHLLFPEYNDHRYSPPTGGGLIFSTGVLHEATEVMQGRRYVLLTHFHSQAAEERQAVDAEEGKVRGSAAGPR